MDKATRKFKRGFKRDDGMIFWRYQSRGDEYWVSQEDFKLKKEKDAESSKKYRECNFSKYKKWFLENKHRVNQISAKRRARKRAGMILVTINDKKIINELYLTAKRIEKCTGIKFEIDHIMPLSKGGLHHPCNLQLLPSLINRRKHAKTDFEY